MEREYKWGRWEKHLWNREEDEDGGRTVDEWMECGRDEGGEQAWISIWRKREGKGWRRWGGAIKREKKGGRSSKEGAGGGRREDGRKCLPFKRKCHHAGGCPYQQTCGQVGQIDSWPLTEATYGREACQKQKNA